MDEIMRHIATINRKAGQSLDAQDNFDPKMGHNKDSEYSEYDSES